MEVRIFKQIQSTQEVVHINVSYLSGHNQVHKLKSIKKIYANTLTIKTQKNQQANDNYRNQIFF